MAWAVLIVSGCMEAGWALALKASHGFSRLWPSVTFVVLSIVSLAGLMYALKSLPVGPAYAVWVGIGASLTAIIGIVWLKDPVNAMVIVSIGLIIAGVIGLQVFGAGH
ncbi:quaternary ammonium compound-resistance protein SugE [Antricoccus suffuscus]|uniref:Quaternary ammonium compound-resistance protein SugE n=1 Tax=Antricoccus suffuscus TaxID=1629062 RepID=A0A2T1A039_9ACTN|nr:multidrug efflux SMR transporter [Antricoccus suffuscus]PRZ41708.1 quaternary ammonium compound-resistance protein SugE [Antricoccus suffuscus]